jgi:hypothetical protein
MGWEAVDWSTRMTANEFISYVGDPDIHDATIIAVQQDSSTARVTLRGVSFDYVDCWDHPRPPDLLLPSGVRITFDDEGRLYAVSAPLQKRADPSEVST